MNNGFNSQDSILNSAMKKIARDSKCKPQCIGAIIGPTGPTGPQGVIGATGPTGPQGPVSVTVGTTTTADPGEQAAVQNTGTDEQPMLDYTVKQEALFQSTHQLQQLP